MTSFGCFSNNEYFLKLKFNKLSFSPSFTTSQVLGSPANIVFGDSSTGSDGAIVGRRIYLQLSNGTFLVLAGNTNQYTNWALASNPFTLSNILTQDEAIFCTIEWVDVNGNVLYVSPQTVGYTLFNETADYKLTQAMAGNPPLMNDNDWFENKSLLRTYIDSGNNAISFAADIFNAQLCYDAATALRLKSKYIFNINC